MVKVSDCTCCDCDSAQEREQIKERALGSVNKIYTFDARTYWPDGTGMLTIPLPTQDQLNKIEEVGTLAETVAADTARIDVTEADIAAIKAGYQKLAEKGSANGYAGLDNNGRVALANLYTGTSANQVPIIGKQLLANEMLVVDADGHTIRSKPVTQTLSFRGIYASKSALPSEGNVSGDYAVVSDGTAQADTGYYVWGYNTATSEYEWVWTILFDANSYQLISNLVTEISNSSDDSHYPSAKAVKDYHDASIRTVEQEITDINNDLATVQTTLGTHETEITAVNTIANRAFDAVSITDNVITLERGNGGTEQITIPTGDSGEWIKITSLSDIDLTKITNNTEIKGSTMLAQSYVNNYCIKCFHMFAIPKTTTAYTKYEFTGTGFIDGSSSSIQHYLNYFLRYSNLYTDKKWHLFGITESKESADLSYIDSNWEEVYIKY